MAESGKIPDGFWKKKADDYDEQDWTYWRSTLVQSFGSATPTHYWNGDKQKKSGTHAYQELRRIIGIHNTKYPDDIWPNSKAGFIEKWGVPKNKRPKSDVPQPLWGGVEAQDPQAPLTTVREEGEEGEETDSQRTETDHASQQDGGSNGAGAADAPDWSVSLEEMKRLEAENAALRAQVELAANLSARGHVANPQSRTHRPAVAAGAAGAASAVSESSEEEDESDEEIAARTPLLARTPVQTDAPKPSPFKRLVAGFKRLIGRTPTQKESDDLRALSETGSDFSDDDIRSVVMRRPSEPGSEGVSHFFATESTVDSGSITTTVQEGVPVADFADEDAVSAKQDVVSAKRMPIDVEMERVDKVPPVDHEHMRFNEHKPEAVAEGAREELKEAIEENRLAEAVGLRSVLQKEDATHKINVLAGAVETLNEQAHHQPKERSDQELKAIANGAVSKEKQESMKPNAGGGADGGFNIGDNKRVALVMLPEAFGIDVDKLKEMMGGRQISVSDPFKKAMAQAQATRAKAESVSLSNAALRSLARGHGKPSIAVGQGGPHGMARHVKTDNRVRMKLKFG